MSKYMAVAYLPVIGVPKEDYRDFLKSEIERIQLEVGLGMGIFPPGLIFQQRGKYALQVFGDYGSRQKLVPLFQVIRIV